MNQESRALCILLFLFQAGPVKQVHRMEMCKVFIDPVLGDVDSTVS